jgi:hypothetical protein
MNVLGQRVTGGEGPDENCAAEDREKERNGEKRSLAMLL